jgi:hypothetical protein
MLMLLLMLAAAVDAADDDDQMMTQNHTGAESPVLTCTLKRARDAC